MTRNEQLISECEKCIELDDIEQIKENFSTLLKAFKKIDNRTGRIIKQSDSQQIDMLKLKENIEQSKNKISVLLNNAGQGFLNCNKNLTISDEMSKEVTRIFGEFIGGKDLSEVLYPDDLEAGIFFKDTMKTILESDEDIQEVLISLLKDEFFIRDSFIEVEYKVIDKESLMLIFTDITSKKELSQKIEDEQQVLKMVVETITTMDQFISVKNDYEVFISRIDSFKSLDKLSNLRKEIHTYKGIFAQKEMLNIVKQLHQFETYIDNSLKTNIIANEINIITTKDMQEWLDDDIKILKEILGETFFKQSNAVSIDKTRIDNLYSNVYEYLKHKNIETLVMLGKDLVKLKYTSIYTMLKPYEKLVEQLSKKLEKNINPLHIECDDIFVPDSFKPFLNTIVHIFRNSVDHGIETSDERIELGKSCEGTIKCNVIDDKKNIIITIVDDGKGIDEDKIKSLAIEKGMYSKEDIDALSQDESLLIIFHDAFSTNSCITEISGRGVGLASVKQELEKLNGTLSIKNDFGNGIKFTFTIPYEVTFYEG